MSLASRALFCFAFFALQWGLGSVYLGKEAWFWAFATFLGAAGFLLVRPSVDLRTRYALITPGADVMMVVAMAGIYLNERVKRGEEFLTVFGILGLSLRVVGLAIFVVGTMVAVRLIFRHDKKKADV